MGQQGSRRQSNVNADFINSYFIVVASVVVAAVRRPVLLNNVLNRDQLAARVECVFVPEGEYGKPRQHGPDTILLSDVVRS